MKSFYVIQVSPEGRPDPECGPAGPFTLDEARGRLREPDPLSGWQELLVQAAALDFTAMVAGLPVDDIDCEHTLLRLVDDAKRVLATGSLSDFVPPQSA